MKILAYTTLLFYSVFSFVFAAICPAVCLTLSSDELCEAICEVEGSDEESCCSQVCEAECPEVDVLAWCSGAYGTQNSFRSDCGCPTAHKPMVVAELQRLVKEFSQVSDDTELVKPDFVSTQIDCIGLMQRPTAISKIISTTVLRI